MAKNNKSKELQFVSFYIADRIYGLDIQIVKEVNTNVSIAKVPLSSKTIRGLVNIRGQIVLVMDIAVVFGSTPRPITETSQLVILKTAQEIRNISNFSIEIDIQKFGDKPTGFLVDTIGDVMTISESIIEPTPPHLADINAPYIKSVANLGKDLLIILNAEEMLHAY
jgi:purine-binding chemotaxis protein CheW